MQEWAIYTLIYMLGYVVISMAVYGVLSLLARPIVTRIVDRTCAELVEDFRVKSKRLLEQGQEIALAGPQQTVLGHLVTPHLEKLTQWVGSRIYNSHAEQVVADRCVEACLSSLRRRRWAISLATAQVAMGLVAAGYLLRGVI